MGIFQTLNIPKNSYIHIYIYIFKNYDVRKSLINNKEFKRRIFKKIIGCQMSQYTKLQPLENWTIQVCLCNTLYHSQV